MQQEEQDQIRNAHYAHLNEYRDDPAYQAVRSYEDRAAFFAKRVGTRWEIDEAIFEEFRSAAAARVARRQLLPERIPVRRHHA